MPKRNLVWIFAILAAAVVTVWVTRSPEPRVTSGRGAFAPVSDAYRLIRENYYRPVDEQKLQEAAVAGMVRQLDEFSSYILPGKLGEFEDQITGIDRGLGLCLDLADGSAEVVGVTYGSPAHRADVAAGDDILAIDSEQIASLTAAEIGELLEGPPETETVLTLRGQDGRVRKTAIVRSEFAVPSVRGLYRDTNGRWSYWIDPDERVAYIRVAEFVQDTAEQFRRAIRLVAPVDALVLDLRGNPGGLMPSGVAVADMFLAEGRIVSVVRESGNETYEAHGDGTLPKFPVVVLVDARTASAAEIVAGAMKLNDRAVVLGTRTRGKGCVQSMFPLPNGLGQINLTTSEFYFEKDKAVTRTTGSDVWGVDPHVQVDMTPEARRELSRLQRKMTAVRPTRATTQPATAPQTLPADPVDELLAADVQLDRAVSLLEHPGRMADILAHEARLRSWRADRRQGDAREPDDE